MRFSPLLLTALVALGLSGAAHAGDDRPDHFKGEPSATLDEAMANFTEYNRRLGAILAKDELGPEDTAEIHRLTYTLENALEKIKDGVEAMEESLEAVHVSSERFELDVVRAQGARYLDTAGKIAR